jgi:hypothetical protein
MECSAKAEKIAGVDVFNVRMGWNTELSGDRPRIGYRDYPGMPLAPLNMDAQYRAKRTQLLTASAPGPESLRHIKGRAQIADALDPQRDNVLIDRPLQWRPGGFELAQKALQLRVKVSTSRSFSDPYAPGMVQEAQSFIRAHQDGAALSAIDWDREYEKDYEGRDWAASHLFAALLTIARREAGLETFDAPVIVEVTAFLKGLATGHPNDQPKPEKLVPPAHFGPAHQAAIEWMATVGKVWTNRHRQTNQIYHSLRW